MEKRLVILGAGESGIGAALLAKSKGLNPFVSDSGMIKDSYRLILQENEIEFEEMQHTLSIITQAKEIVKSPGIPNSAPVISEIQKNDIRIISELELAYRYTNAKIIAITGTNGKTTTTLLVHHLLKNSGFKVGLAGNVGDSLAKQVIDSDNDIYVVEVSSFQLDDLINFTADVGILLNITPDHLDRYDNFEKYADSKFGITNNQGAKDSFVYNYDDNLIKEKVEKGITQSEHYPFSLENPLPQGAFLSNDNLYFLVDGKEYILPCNEIPIQGKHNQANSMAAIIASLLAGADFNKIKDAISSFENAPHRMENVAEIQGVTFINDSKATNVESALQALQSYDHISWIAGGIDKGNDYDLLNDTVKENVHTLVCLGKDNSKLLDAFKNVIRNIYETTELDDAVNVAFTQSKGIGVVLMSPACASFDLFDNYQQRGDLYKKVVMNLKLEMEKN